MLNISVIDMLFCLLLGQKYAQNEINFADQAALTMDVREPIDGYNEYMLLNFTSNIETSPSPHTRAAYSGVLTIGNSCCCLLRHRDPWAPSVRRSVCLGTAGRQLPGEQRFCQQRRCDWHWCVCCQI